MSDTPHFIRLLPDGPAEQGMEPMALDPSDFQSPLPQQNIGIFFEDAERGITVGVWDTTTMLEAHGPYPGDEVVWILEGDFSMLGANGGSAKAGKGNFVALRNGAPMSWKQDGYLKKFFLIYLKPNTPDPMLDNAKGATVVADPNALPSNAASSGAEERHEDFRNDTGDLSVGTWRSGALSQPMSPYPVDEFGVILEGSATVTEQSGDVHILRAGDCFFLPKGTVCQFVVPSHIKAHYARIESA